MYSENPKELIWLGDSLKELRSFPEDVRDTFGYALYEAQLGKFPRNAKPLTGLGPGVIEIVCDFDRNTYRSVYTAKMGNCLYVLHCLQKKSKHGIATPKQEIDLIKQRLRHAKYLSESKNEN